jgi:acyl carrier protein
MKMRNQEKLKTLIVDVFLLKKTEFNLELKKEQIETWDSLGTISLAVGIKDSFGYHMSPEEATKIRSVQDIINLLETKGISFRD